MKESAETSTGCFDIWACMAYLRVGAVPRVHTLLWPRECDLPCDLCHSQNRLSSECAKRVCFAPESRPSADTTGGRRWAQEPTHASQQSAAMPRRSLAARVQTEPFAATHEKLCRCLSPGDLIGGVAVYHKYGIVAWVPREVRVDIFPDHIALRRHLEESTEQAFIDECIPVGQPLCVRNSRAEKIRRPGLLILPHDILRRRIDFENAREGERCVQSMRAVIEQQHVPVCEYVRGVLAGKRRSAELPIDRSGLPIDHHDRGDMPETEQDVPVCHLENAVAVSPFIAVVLDGGDGVLDRIEMLPRPPLPDDPSIGRHLDKVVGEHLAVVELGAGATAADFGDDIL